MIDFKGFGSSTVGTSFVANERGNLEITVQA
jgi:hypothetical protein